MGIVHRGGTYNGKRFASDRVVTEEQAKSSLPAEEDPDFDTPCTEPAGGWRATYPSRVTDGDCGDGVVDLSVVFDDGTLQRTLDDRYGAGLVRVRSAPQPYRG